MDKLLMKRREDDLRRVVGEQLALLRSSKGLRQSDWTKRYSDWIIRQSNLANWESGLAYPPMTFLAQLCKDYNVTMDEFFHPRQFQFQRKTTRAKALAD